MITHLSTWAAMLAASSSSTAKASAGSTLAGLLPLLLIGVLAWLLFFRPRSQAAKRQREDIMTLDVGDEVLTGAGIFGTIVDIDGDRVLLETAPGSQVTVLRSTIARRLTEPEPEPDEHDEWHTPEHDDWDDAHEDTHDQRAHGANGTVDPGHGDDDRDEGTARSGEGG
jgi:preprotein translocase subunit YajC